MNEINELREEIAKLRERIAVLESRRAAPTPSIDWTKPLQVGTPQQWVPSHLPIGTIWC